jgi:hypothetical protein
MLTAAKIVKVYIEHLKSVFGRRYYIVTCMSDYTQCVQDLTGLIFFNFALQCHLLASCGVKILNVSAVAVHNFKAQASLHHVF